MTEESPMMTPEGIAKLVSDPNVTLSSEQLLILKSRSFAGPIMLLETLCGPDEQNKRLYVMGTYNLLREADEVEDSPIPQTEKTESLDRLKYLVGEVARASNIGSVEDIIKGEDLKGITQKLVQGVVEEDARIFAEHFGKGPVLRELYSFKPEQREAIHYALGTMTDAMSRFLKLGEIKTADQLHDYCFHVAGRVGKYLTTLVQSMDGIQLNADDAEKFGAYLQLINILKGVRSDYKEGRAFLPSEFLPEKIPRKYMMDEQWDDAKAARKQVVDKTVALIDENFPAAVRYVKSIPPHLPGFKAFCTIPLVMGQKLKEVMVKAGPEAIIEGKESILRPPYDRGVYLGLATKVARDNDFSNSFYDKFERNPESVNLEELDLD